MITSRTNWNILRDFESSALKFLVPRTPKWATPDRLTALSLFGAGVAGVSLVCCWFSAWFLVALVVGLFLNWLGDSLDGAIARYRKCERHRAGFLIDRAADVLSFSIILIGLGNSPYMSVTSSLFLLLTYFLHTIYTLMRTVTDGIHHVGVGGVGATEGRIMVACGAIIGQIGGPAFLGFQIHGISAFSALWMGGFVGATVIFVRRVAGDIAHIEIGDSGAAGSIRPADNVVPIAVKAVARLRNAKNGREHSPAANYRDAEASKETAVPI